MNRQILQRNAPLSLRKDRRSRWTTRMLQAWTRCSILQALSSRAATCTSAAAATSRRRVSRRRTAERSGLAAARTTRMSRGDDGGLRTPERRSRCKIRGVARACSPFRQERERHREQAVGGLRYHRGEVKQLDGVHLHRLRRPVAICLLHIGRCTSVSCWVRRTNKDACANY